MGAHQTLPSKSLQIRISSFVSSRLSQLMTEAENGSECYFRSNKASVTQEK